MKTTLEYLREHLLIVSIITFITLIALLGIGSSQSTLTHVEYEQARYITAEYSETSMQTYVDADGSISTEMETDYWSESASVTWFYTVVNNDTVKESWGGKKYKGYPEVTIDAPESNFDGYKKHKDESYKAYFMDGTSTNIQRSKYNEYLERVGDEINYRTWYGLKMWELKIKSSKN